MNQNLESDSPILSQSTSSSNRSYSDISLPYRGADSSSNGHFIPSFSEDGSKPVNTPSGVSDSSGHDIGGSGSDSSVSSSSTSPGSGSGSLDHNSNRADAQGGQFDNAFGMQSDDVDTSHDNPRQENPSDPPYIRDFSVPPEDSQRSNHVNVLYFSDEGVPSGSSHDPTAPYSEVGVSAMRGGGDTGARADATDRPEVQEMFNISGIGPIYNPETTVHNPNMGDSGSSAQDFVDKVRDILRPIDLGQKVESVPFDMVSHLSGVSRVEQDLYKKAHLLGKLGPLTFGADLVASGIEYVDALNHGDLYRASDVAMDAALSMAGEALHLISLPLGIAYDIYSAYNDLSEMNKPSHQR